MSDTTKTRLCVGPSKRAVKSAHCREHAYLPPALAYLLGHGRTVRSELDAYSGID